MNFEGNDFDINEFHESENNLYKIQCDNVCDDSENGNILDLTVIGLGHFFIISVENCDYLYECQEQHNPTVCVSFFKLQIKIN